jgi:hypothetical protein
MNNETKNTVCIVREWSKDDKNETINIVRKSENGQKTINNETLDKV